MGRSLHTELYIHIIIKKKDQIYDTLIRHGCIFKLLPHDGNKIFKSQIAENGMDSLQYITKLL